MFFYEKMADPKESALLQRGVRDIIIQVDYVFPEIFRIKTNVVLNGIDFK